MNHLIWIIYIVGSKDIEEEGSTLELDSCVHFMVVGKHARTISYTGRKVSVSGFTNELRKYKLVYVPNTSISYDYECTVKS